MYEYEQTKFMYWRPEPSLEDELNSLVREQRRAELVQKAASVMMPPLLHMLGFREIPHQSFPMDQRSSD